MFGKLREKLKEWAGKISAQKGDEVSKEAQNAATEELGKKKESSKKAGKKREGAKVMEPEKSGKDDVKYSDIDESLKTEVSKEAYAEPEKEFNAGIEAFVPDAQKSVGKLEEKKEKKSIFRSIFSGKRVISSDEFHDYSEDLEMILLENNVALEVAEKVISELEIKIVGKEIEKKDLEGVIKKSLKEILAEVLVKPFDIVREIEEKKSPYVILFCGINGAGKTTTIAKFADMLKKKNIPLVLGAADTFRAASIEQLEKHGEKLGVAVISHEYGSDPASVGFDTVKYAGKNGIKAVLIDTAGRMHTAKNLLREMEKIKRVTKPDRVIFLGESITGNDSVDQVRAFDEAIGIDGIILSKADIDEKGGTALSVGYITKKPILFLGTGQEYKDLEPFDREKFIEKLGL
ncbi:MAG: signal recognition particle-docking protein FtsY [Candidatus Pacearchaeota archaeon]|jgi:fused signal recognition particle receptor|nr:signal recognition particle-docking protein FtsY [Candidatus Pacearchaeota archaeon]